MIILCNPDNSLKAFINELLFDEFFSDMSDIRIDLNNGTKYYHFLNYSTIDVYDVNDNLSMFICISPGDYMYLDENVKC